MAQLTWDLVALQSCKALRYRPLKIYAFLLFWQEVAARTDGASKRGQIKFYLFILQLFLFLHLTSPHGGLDKSFVIMGCWVRLLVLDCYRKIENLKKFFISSRVSPLPFISQFSNSQNHFLYRRPNCKKAVTNLGRYRAWFLLARLRKLKLTRIKLRIPLANL